MDANLEHAVEAFNAATLKLGHIEADLRINTHDLKVARSNLRLGQRAIAQRLVALYTAGGDGTSTLEVLLGSVSLNDMLNRIDTAKNVSDQDTRVLRDVKHFRVAVKKQQRELQHAHAQQRKVVADRAAQRSSIQSQLADRQRYLQSVHGQIAQLQREEAARQARLEAQARQRLQLQRQVSSLRQTDPVVGVAATSPDGATVAPPSQYGGVVGVAMQYLGTPYVWGGSSPGGFDCSGFVAYVYAQMGVSLPHLAAAQYSYGTPVSQSDLQPGDLVFFDGLGHVGIYIGGGQFIHSPHTGDVVKISSLSDSWYAATYVGGRRL
jgi:cell wall-associated NlpC family hydrolase